MRQSLAACSSTSRCGRNAYEWPNPETNYRIAGLTPQTHAPYCRDGLAALLKAVPNITGLSVRMHGESGIPDGDYAFWETLFAAIKPAGRRIDLDLHAKGTDQRHINIALGTGMPVSMAPKFWASIWACRTTRPRSEKTRCGRPGPTSHGTPPPCALPPLRLR